MRKIKKRERTKLSVLKRREEQKGKSVRGYRTRRLNTVRKAEWRREDIVSAGISFNYPM